MLRIITILLNIICFSSVIAQTEIKGVLIDSTYNNVLQSATVASFQKGVKTVEKVSLTDRFGKFVIEGLPYDKPLLIEFSFQGFSKIIKELQLKKDEKKDLGHINMSMLVNELAAVEVFPPVRMRGDTLEFNADAFQLDSNAVIEDLLHKLPGIVVWGDGTITYNGKEMPHLLVNGKQFFGSDKSVALQNIAKDAVKKLQVYDRRKQEDQLKNPYDPIYEMNVVLKDGKEKMYFGNVMLGGGTQERYEGNLNFNYADRRTQSTLAYSINNINKNLRSIDQLLKNTTFKGAGVKSDFDSDFLRSGVVKQNVLGGRYQYDFLGIKEVNKKNIINGSILNNWENSISQDSTVSQLITEDLGDTNLRYSKQNSRQDLKKNLGNVEYEYQGYLGNRSIHIESSFAIENNDIENGSSSSTQYDYINNQSLNTIYRNEQAENKNLNIDLNIRIGSIAKSSDTKMQIEDTRKKRTIWEKANINLRAKMDFDNLESFSENQSNYQNFLSPELNKDHNRSYNRDEGNRNQSIGATLNIENFAFNQELQLHQKTAEDLVDDIRNNTLVENTVLSHQSTFSQISYNLSLSYLKPIYAINLTGRMMKSLRLLTKMGVNLYKEKNQSTLDYRNLSQDYVTFLPALGLRQSYSKLGKYTQSANLLYNYNEEYPTLEQLRPIYDDINPAYRFFGAEKLSKTLKHIFTGDIQYAEQKANGYTVYLKATHTILKNGVSDSVVNIENQQQYYLGQTNRPMYQFNTHININKSLLIVDGQSLAVTFKGYLNWSNRFQFLNDQEQEILAKAQNISIDVYYTLKDRFKIGWANNWSRYFRIEKVLERNSIKSINLNSGLSLSYALSKKLTINTNGNHRLFSSTYNTNSALIWNANSTYRFMKGNNLGLKFAIYDILRQNKGIYFNNGLTEFTTGYRNNLIHYCMLSISYYPQKFGL